jgi:hypothetical protein
MGLFANQGTNQGRAFKQYRAHKGAEVLDSFADLLADGVSTGHAAMKLGFTPGHGRVLLQRIVDKLGWQAC